jgi:type VI secretion system secreted protein Hcp
MSIKLAAVSVVAAAMVLITLNAGGGSLEPDAPPGPTMHTLDEIYNAVSSGGTTTPAAYNGFLKIDVINGESTDENHKDWIEILSYSHGVEIPVSGTGGGGITGPSVHEDIVVVKELDKSSPKLYLHCCQGQRLNQVIMELCKSAGDRPRFLKYELHDVIVTSVRPGGSSDGDPIPTEEVTLNYGKIEWTYTEIDPTTGDPVGDVGTWWDRASNTGGNL